MTAVLTSRGALGWLGAVLSGGLSAAAFIIATLHADTLLIAAGYLAALPLLVSGLGSGKSSGVFASLIGSAAVFLVTGNVFVSLLYALVYAFPSALLVILALRYRTSETQKVFWYPEGYLIQALVFYPAVIFLVACGAAYAMGEENGLLGLTLRALNDILALMSQQVQQALTDNAQNGIALSPEEIGQYQEGLKQITTVLPQIAKTAPSMMGSSWAVFMIINGIIAQIMMAQQGWNLRDNFSLRAVRSSSWLVIVVALLGVVGLLAPESISYIAINLCVLLSLPFFFVGLSVLHGYAATLKMPRLFLTLIYLLLTVLPWLVLFAALLGVIEQKFNLRQRFLKRSKPI